MLLGELSRYKLNPMQKHKKTAKLAFWNSLDNAQMDSGHQQCRRIAWGSWRKNVNTCRRVCGW